MGTTYYEAAIQVLRSAQHPLTAREITTHAIENGLITPVGRTPDATMSAVLYVHARKDTTFTKIEEPGNGRAKRGSVRWMLTLRNAEHLGS
jgi:HB1, ASXL, restriction endonuclease HTH domain